MAIVYIACIVGAILIIGLGVPHGAPVETGLAVNTRRRADAPRYRTGPQTDRSATALEISVSRLMMLSQPAGFVCYRNPARLVLVK